MKTVSISRLHDYCDTKHVADDASAPIYLPRFRVQPVLKFSESYMPLAAPCYFVFKDEPRFALGASEKYLQEMRENAESLSLARTMCLLVQGVMYQNGIAVQENKDAMLYGKVTANVHEMLALAENRIGTGAVDGVHQESRAMFDQIHLEKAMHGLAPEYMTGRHKDYFRL